VFLLSSATVILATLFTDITYGYLDPRVRAS
jgi:ABC-type dipeptide/oligopeptide/nickel transport system permease component